MIGEALRDQGIERVARANGEWLERMRARARVLSFVKGEVSAADLRSFAKRTNDHPTHPNAWGAVFRGPKWRPVGRIKNPTITAHARSVITWRWVEGEDNG